MNYTEAVALAKAGKEAGFTYLYENTYQSKYYLALRYMKDEEAAKDVLQDSYIKAFAKLDTLDNPEAFASWLGIIVANTAKNMLEKNNPLLFADVAVDADGESFEYQIEDDTLATQPELAYTRKETQELVHELIDSLSEEQRLCILMFHIEGASISEIAATMNVSENTVKSRLNYGRKNLKLKAEELKKKGYKLYNSAPLPLLLLLLRTEKKAMATDGTTAAATKGVGDTVTNTAINGVGAAVKVGFVHTVTGKIVVAAMGISVTGAAVFAGKQIATKNVPVQTETVDQLQTSSQNQETNFGTELANSFTVEAVYKKVLQSIQNKETGYEFTAVDSYTGEYRYFVEDINGDGIQDLVVGATYTVDVFYGSDIRVFTCKPSGDGYELVIVNGEVAAITLSIAGDGNGLFNEEFSRGGGQTEIYRITITDNMVSMNSTPEMRFTFGDSTAEAYNAANPLPDWRDISNLSRL